MLISQQTDLNPLFTGDTNAIMTELQRYGDSITVNGTLGLSNIADDFARRLFMHQILYAYKKNNIAAPNKDLMSFLRYLGMVNISTTQALKVGFSIDEKKKKYITNATVTVTGTAGGAVKIELPAEFSLASGMILDLNDILEIGETRFQVRVIGLDNGTGNGLSVLGKRANGSAMTAGADGGTASANVIIVLPVSQQAVPNFTTDEKLFFVGNTKEEMSCPDNALLEAYPNIYECGFTIVDEYTKVSGTANSTRLNDRVMVTNANGQNVEIFATMADVQLWDEFRNKLYAQVAFGQKETNTSATLSTSHNTRNANGIIPSIAVNGGLQILTTPGSISFTNTIEPLVDACIQNGVYSGILLAGHDIYGEIQAAVPATGNYWKDNIRIEPMMGANGQMEFQFTTGAIEVRGVHIKIVPFTMFNDFNQWGIGYANTAVFIPEKMATVKDAKTDAIVSAPPISVLFKKDKYGRVRDENYMTSDGGAALRQSGVCDYELTRRLAEFTVVSPLASECILLQPVTIS